MSFGKVKAIFLSPWNAEPLDTRGVAASISINKDKEKKNVQNNSKNAHKYMHYIVFKIRFFKPLKNITIFIP